MIVQVLSSFGKSCRPSTDHWEAAQGTRVGVPLPHSTGGLPILSIQPLQSQVLMTNSVLYTHHLELCSLRVVVHSKVNHSDYSTLSLHGVTRMIAGREPEFTDLDQWVCDLEHFNKLVKIGTFAKFRMWKAFATWRKNVRSRCIVLYMCCNMYWFEVHTFFDISGKYRSVRNLWRKTCLSCTHNCRGHFWRSGVTARLTTRVN